MTERAASAERCADAMRDILDRLQRAANRQRIVKAELAAFEDAKNKTLSLCDMLEPLTFESITEAVHRYRRKTPGWERPERIRIREGQYIELERLRGPAGQYSTNADRYDGPPLLMGIEVCICESR